MRLSLQASAISFRVCTSRGLYRFSQFLSVYRFVSAGIGSQEWVLEL
jgi:hypothetical protein